MTTRKRAMVMVTRVAVKEEGNGKGRQSNDNGDKEGGGNKEGNGEQRQC